MLIYIITFSISILFTYIAEKKQSHKLIYYSFSFLAIMFPTLLAGLRDLSIGTDASGYIFWDFKYAHIVSSFDELKKIANQEYLFLFINFIVAKFSNNISIVLLIYQLIIQILIYNACFYNRKKCSMWISYACFLFVFFNKSLNMTRQSIAIAIILYAYKFIKEKKIIKYMISVAIATLFHTPAILTISFYFINLFLYSKKYDKINKFIIFIFTIVVCVSFTTLVNLLVMKYQILDSRYLYYFQNNKVNFESAMLIFILCILTLILIYRKQLIKLDSDHNNFIIFIYEAGVILWIICTRYTFLSRIAYYLIYFFILILPQLPFTQKSKESKNIMKVLICVILISFFIVYYGILKNDATVPYILGV